MFFFFNAFHLKDCPLLRDYFLACLDVQMSFYETIMIENRICRNRDSWQNKMLADDLSSQVFCCLFCWSMKLVSLVPIQKSKTLLRDIHHEILQRRKLSKHPYISEGEITKTSRANPCLEVE